MRCFLAALAVASVLACGGADAAAPPTVAITFKVDAQTCSGSASLDFFIDGSQVGTETIAAGGSTAKTYTTTASAHSLGAQVSNTHSRIWGPFVVNLSGLGAYTQILTCA